MSSPLTSATDLLRALPGRVVVDCRFALTDPGAGERAYRKAHLPGAHYLHLERDLSAAPAGVHGGRHPLPAPAAFARRLAQLGIGCDTPVVAYDDSRFAFAARLWWMMTSLGYRNVQVLDGGLAAWVAAGGDMESAVPTPRAVSPCEVGEFRQCLAIEEVRDAMADGAVLVDSREEKRFLGLEEPIDPVAGHIPGAINLPWQEVTDERGMALGTAQQAARWEGAGEAGELVVYCGSGVTACVNLLSLAIAGKSGASLYAGSWSDWCSYMPRDDA